MRRVSDTVSYSVLLAIGALCIATFLLVRLPRAQAGCVLGMDGKGYFSYLRSFVFDGDLDFHNEYANLDAVWEETPSTGLPVNPYPVGPALLWAPFYLCGLLFSLMARAAGIQVDTNGYGLVYQSAICIATIVYVTVGCLLTYRVCRRYFCSFPSLLAVVGLWLASSLFHYTLSACDMAHGVSFFTVSLFLFVWHPPRCRTYREWVLLGFCAGLMTLSRWEGLLYLGVLAVEGIQAVKDADRGRRVAILREYVKGGLVVGLVAAVVFTPQMLAWGVLYGSPITVPQAGDYDFDFAHPKLLEYLFSTRNGLYTWTPIVLFATVGFALLWRRDRKVTAALLAALLAQWWLWAARTEWWGGAAFGARRFISATPLLMLGMAALTESVTERFRHGYVVMLGTVSTLVVWNLLFDLQFSWGFIPPGEAISFHQLTIGKFEMVLELLGRLVNKL